MSPFDRGVRLSLGPWRTLLFSVENVQIFFSGHACDHHGCPASETNTRSSRESFNGGRAGASSRTCWQWRAAARRIAPPVGRPLQARRIGGRRACPRVGREKRPRGQHGRTSSAPMGCRTRRRSVAAAFGPTHRSVPSHHVRWIGQIPRFAACVTIVTLDGTEGLEGTEDSGILPGNLSQPARVKLPSPHWRSSDSAHSASPPWCGKSAPEAIASRSG